MFWPEAFAWVVIFSRFLSALGQLLQPSDVNNSINTNGLLDNESSMPAWLEKAVAVKSATVGLSAEGVGESEIYMIPPSNPATTASVSN